MGTYATAVYKNFREALSTDTSAFLEGVDTMQENSSKLGGDLQVLAGSSSVTGLTSKVLSGQNYIRERKDEKDSDCSCPWHREWLYAGGW